MNFESCHDTLRLSFQSSCEAGCELLVDERVKDKTSTTRLKTGGETLLLRVAVSTTPSILSSLFNLLLRVASQLHNSTKPSILRINSNSSWSR